jgi:hypothetical protein
MSTTIDVSCRFPVSTHEYLLFMKDQGMLDYIKQGAGRIKADVGPMRDEGKMRIWEADVLLLEAIPSFFRALVPSERIRWKQRFRLDLERLEFSIETEHGFSPSLLEVRGQGKIRERGADGSAMTIVLTFTSKVPGLGHRIEQGVAEKVKKSLEQELKRRADYITEHRGRLLHDHPDAPSTPA